MATGRRMDALLLDYGASHQTRGNRACHAVGITLILFGVFSMLGTIPIHLPVHIGIGGGWTASEILIALAFLFYAALDVPLAFAVLAYTGLLDLGARAVADWRIGLAAFAVGWVFQAIGHAVYEKSKPAFLRNLVHLLIGPAFLVAEALHRRPAER